MAKKSKVAPNSTQPTLGGVNPTDDSDWKGEQHANDLLRAGEVMADPEKMALAKKHLRKKKHAMKSVSDLVKFRNDKFGAKPKPDMEVDNDADDSGI